MSRKFEVKPSAYLRHRGREVPDGEVREARVAVGRHERRLASARSEADRAPITGRYAVVGTRVSFHVNQAGTHIECWVSGNIGGKRPKEISRYGGDRKGDGFALYVHPDRTKQIGSLKRSPENQNVLVLKLDWEDRERLLALDFRKPTLSERALAVLPGSQEIVRAYEWYPIILGDRVKLQMALHHDVIEYFLRRWQDAHGSRFAERLERGKRAKELDDYIAVVFSTGPVISKATLPVRRVPRDAPTMPDGVDLPAMALPDWEGWDPSDFLLANYYARLMLASRRFAYDKIDLTHLEWLQRVVDSEGQAATGGGSTVKNISAHFGITSYPDPNNRPTYEYDLHLEVAGFNALVGGYAGKLTVISKTPGYEFNHTFGMGLFSMGLGFGKGLSAGFKTNGSATTHSLWLPSDFPGTVIVHDAGVTVAADSAGITLMTIEGSGHHPAMLADFSGHADVNGLAIGVGWTESLGHLFESFLGDGNPRDFKSADVLVKDDNYTVTSSAKDEVHFKLGSALLTPAGWQLLRIVCAIELAMLASPASFLVVRGHADRVDTEGRNIELSNLRAKNVVQALRDILGGDFGIPSHLIFAVGLGELEATRAGDQNGSPNQRWRKVEVLLNSRLVVTLYGD